MRYKRQVEKRQKLASAHSRTEEMRMKHEERQCVHGNENRFYDTRCRRKITDQLGYQVWQLGCCKKQWQFKWTEIARGLNAGATHTKTTETGQGTSSSTTTQTEVTVSHGVGVSAESPMCGTYCGGLDVTVSVGVAAAVASSVESGSYTSTSTENSVVVPGTQYAKNANGANTRVNGWRLFAFSSNFQESGWVTTDTTIAMPTFLNDKPEPKCFPGQFPKNFVVASHADCRGESGKTHKFTVNWKGLAKGDYMCKDQLFQFPPRPPASPEMLAMQQRERNRLGSNNYCTHYDAFWKAVTGIQYNVQSVKFKTTVGTTNTESRTEETGYALSIGASVTVTGGGAMAETQATYENSESKALMEEFSATKSVSVEEDCAASEYKKYGGHDIQGWQIFMWTLRGRECPNRPAGKGLQDYASGRIVCAPVVDGQVITPRCQPDMGWGPFHRYCRNKWKFRGFDCDQLQRRRGKIRM